VARATGEAEHRRRREAHRGGQAGGEVAAEKPAMKDDPTTWEHCPGCVICDADDVWDDEAASAAKDWE
jgi:hypothetical protein